MRAEPPFNLRQGAFISRRTLACTLALALLAGCTSLAPQQSKIVSGRFSARAASAQGAKAASGRFRLIMSPGRDELELLTPLYGILGRVIVTQTGAVLERGSHEPLKASSAEELMQESLGFSLPVAMLKSWLEGRPDAARESRTISAETFEQAGWTVAVRRRRADGAPAVLALTKGELIHLTLALDDPS